MAEIYAQIVAQSTNSQPPTRPDHGPIVMIAAIMDVQPHDRRGPARHDRWTPKDLDEPCRKRRAPIEA
jgi:hypothetical protein